MSAGKGTPCPICDKPADERHQPFCSARCKDVDLNRWLSEGYRIPGNPSNDDSDGVPDPNIPSDSDTFDDFDRSSRTHH